MKNSNYNLLNILTQKLQAIWRYDQYIQDAEKEGCQSCVELWKRLKKIDQSQIQELRAEIENHVRQDIFE